MKSAEKIDKMISQKLSQWEIQPPLDSYAGIRRKMKWVNFWKYGVLRIVTSHRMVMIYSLLSLIVIVNGTLNFFSSHSTITGLKYENQSFEFEKFSKLLFNIERNDSGNVNPQEKNLLRVSVSNDEELFVDHGLNSTLTNHTTNEQEQIEEINSHISFSSIYNQYSKTNSPSSQFHVTDVTLQDNHFAPEILSRDRNMEDMDLHFVVFDKNMVMIPPVKQMSSVPDLLKTSSHTQSNLSEWTTSAGLSAGFHKMIQPISIYNNDAFSTSDIINGSTINADFYFENKNITIISGIDFSNYNQNFFAENIVHNPHTDVQINHVGSMIEIDSTGFWQYYYMSDSVIHIVDSVWKWSVDTTYIDMFDTLYVNQSDTMKNVYWSTHYQQISVPLLLSKKFVFGRFVFSLSGGVSLGIFKAKQGNVLYSNQLEYPFRTLCSIIPEYYFTVSAVGMLSAGYFLSERVIVELKPFLIYQLNRIKIQEFNNNIQLHKYGLSLGLRYYF